MHAGACAHSDTAARVQQLEQYVQQLQQEASTAGALEYRCEGLQQEKQQLAQQLQQLKGNVVQMQSSLHQERLHRQEREATAAQLEAGKLQLQTRCVDLEAKLRVAEQRADEAEEEQLRTEQQLTAATSELQSARQTPQHAHHEAQAYQPAERNTQEELHAAHTRAHDLQMSLASAESMLNSTQRQLESANERLNQLEQSAYGPSVDGDRPGVDGQAYPNGVSQLPLGQKAGSGQLPSWVGADKDLSLSDDTAQLVQRLRGHVTSLKASRDKLLLEVNKQSLEIERLLVENTALEQALLHSQESAQTWEVQAQANLQHMDQLKTLLEESAFWQSQSSQSSTPPSDNASKHQHQATSDEGQLQRQVLQEKVRVTDLEVQVRALCLELAHARHNAELVNQSLEPTLGSIGSRLVQLLQVNSMPQAAR